MGSCISRIYDDYDDYKYICEIKSIEPLDVRATKSFYEHAKEIIASFTEEERKKHENSYPYKHFK